LDSTLTTLPVHTLAVSWTQTMTYEDVAISAVLATGTRWIVRNDALIKGGGWRAKRDCSVNKGDEKRGKRRCRRQSRSRRSIRPPELRIPALEHLATKPIVHEGECVKRFQ
jgi:hypothetical protein